MYTIKGQDQKDYGPVDADQIRQWLAQGRVDARTPVLVAGVADWRPLGTLPEFAAPAVPPPLRSTAPLPPDSGVATIIPYRNVPALVAYYLGVFSLIPCIGFVLGIGAFILGIMGLKRYQQYPEAKGKVHAWVGIVLGILVVLAHLSFFVIGLMAASRHR